MNRLADLPIDMLPISFSAPMAYAEFIVVALMTSSGVIFSFMEPNEEMKFMFPLGEDPGL